MTNSTENILKENIKKYRQLKGYSQEKLSEIANISADYLSEIERGKKLPSFKRFLMIANALNVEPYKFLVKE